MDTLKKVDLFGVLSIFNERNPRYTSHTIYEREHIMSKILFNEHQRRQIEANPNVASVSDRSIQYTAAFKLKAVQENLSGKGPVQIFKEAGFDLEIIGAQKAKSALSRWKNTYKTLGEKGFLEERRGKGSTGRPRAEKLSADKKLEKAEARIRLLEAELALLKKLDEMERQAKKKRF